MTARPPRQPAHVGDYVLDEVVGRGSVGTVYRARRADWHDRVVALKRVAGGDRARTARAEADVLAALDHPHIVRVLELVPDGDGVAIAMQYAPGGSLAALVTKRGRLPANEVVALAAPLADALASAHRQGVVHGDVASANVLLTADGEPLLSDFGLARPAGAGVPASVVGTAEYLDPAVAAGAAPDERSDVYGLGAVCYEMLTGRPPCEATTLEGVVETAAARRRLPLCVAAPDVPAVLGEVVERALAPDPGERFPDAATFAEALRAAVPIAAGEAGLADVAEAETAGADTAVVPRRPTRAFGPRPPVRRPPAPAPRPGSRRRRWVAVVVVGVAGVGAVAGVAGVGAAFGGGRPVPTASEAALPAAAAAAAARPAAPACAPVTAAPAADVDGDGCPEAVAWDGAVAEVDGRRYQLGRPGDVLLLGDWDCDGKATPALHRPVTGAVHVFAGWAGPEGPLAAVEGARGPAGGVARVVRDAGGCDRVEVEPPPAAGAAPAVSGPAPGP